MNEQARLRPALAALIVTAVLPIGPFAAAAEPAAEDGSSTWVAPVGAGPERFLRAPVIQLASNEGAKAQEAERLKKDDAAYLQALGLIRGRLNVAMDLNGRGLAERAQSHMKHSGDEIHATLAPALDVRHATSFGEELGRMADAAKSAAPARLSAIVLLIREAAGKLGEAVKNGRVVELHEYQDSLGFVRSARVMFDRMSEAERRQAGPAIAEIDRHLDDVAKLYPDVVPPENVNIDAVQVLVAAACIEIAALQAR